VEGSGKMPLTSEALHLRSLRRKSFLSSMEKSALTERRSMKMAFSLRAGIWLRGDSWIGRGEE